MSKEFSTCNDVSNPPARESNSIKLAAQVDGSDDVTGGRPRRSIFQTTRMSPSFSRKQFQH